MPGGWSGVERSTKSGWKISSTIDGIPWLKPCSKRRRMRVLCSSADTIVAPQVTMHLRKNLTREFVRLNSRAAFGWLHHLDAHAAPFALAGPTGDLSGLPA